MDKNTEHFLSALDMLDEKFIESALEVMTDEKRTENISADDFVECEAQSHKASRLSIFALTAASVAVVIAVMSLVAVITLNKIPVADSYSSFVSGLFSSSEDGISSDESSSDYASVPDMKIKEKIKLMAYYEPDNEHPAFKTFRELYGTPEIIPDGYEAKKDDIFAIKLTGYYERFEKLNKAINSGDSPDITPFIHSNHYSGEYCARYGYNNDGESLFEPIDNVIDINEPLWDKVRWMNEKFTTGDKQYAAITSTTLLYDSGEFLWYKKSRMEEYGLSDPYELYISGEWTWDKFSEYADLHSRSGDGTAYLSSCSYLLAEAFASASGIGFIDTQKGRLVSKLTDEKTVTCMDFLEGLISSYRINVYDYTKVSELVDNETLFLQMGALKYEEIANYIGRGDISEGDLGIVPVPKKDNQTEHYYPVYADGYYLCKGGNADNFTAVINACLISYNNGLTDSYNMELLKNAGLNSEQLQRVSDVYQKAKLNPVIDMFFGMITYNHTPDVCAGLDNADYLIVISPVRKEMSYKEAVDLYGEELEKKLDKINN